MKIIFLRKKDKRQNMNIINRYTCNSSQLRKLILHLKANKTPPIIDYIREYYHPDNAFEIKSKMKIFPNNHFSVKLSALGIKENEDLCYMHTDSIIQCAIENNCKVLIDAEQHDIQENIDIMSLDFMKRYNGINVNVYKTYQMYKKGSIENLRNDLDNTRDYFIGVKLVRGAYLHEDKNKNVLCDSENETHNQYNNGIELFTNFHNSNDIMLCATHNIKSIHIARYYMNKYKMNNIQFAQLLGMSDSLTTHLQKSGYKVFKYLPYGPFHESIPYLTRRLFENTNMIKYLY